jgi:hypothetical protein
MPVIQQSGGRSRRILSRDQPGLHSETMSLKKKKLWKTTEQTVAICYLGRVGLNEDGKRLMPSLRTSKLSNILNSIALII